VAWEQANRIEGDHQLAFRPTVSVHLCHLIAPMSSRQEVPEPAQQSGAASALLSMGRFSACRTTRLAGPSLTPALISSPRWAISIVQIAARMGARIGAPAGLHRGRSRRRPAPLPVVPAPAHRGPDIGVEAWAPHTGSHGSCQLQAATPRQPGPGLAPARLNQAGSQLRAIRTLTPSRCSRRAAASGPRVAIAHVGQAQRHRGCRRHL